MQRRWGFLAATLTLASPASADDARREACAAAYEDAQRAMRESRLLVARERLAVCIEDACAPFIRTSCAEWLDDVTARLPSVIVSLVRRDGAPLAPGSPVSLSVDGVPWELVPGKAREIDPGEHTFLVQARGEAPAQARVFIRERERSQRVALELGAAPAAKAPGEPAHRPVPPLAIGLGAVGLLSAAGFGTFAAIGASEQSELDRCRGTCSQEEVDRVRSRYVVADVFLGVSLVSLGVAAVVYLTRPSVSPVARGPQVQF